MAVDALTKPFYSVGHPDGADIQRNQFDLGNPGLGKVVSDVVRA